MLLLFGEGDAGLTTRRPGLWNRLTVGFCASRLDRELAAGASPDADAQRALRAQVLVRMSVRRHLARSVQRILDVPTRPFAAGRTSVPLCRERVVEASAELRSLIDHLLAPGPVPARGVALARALLGDGSGPLYNLGSTDDLRRTVTEAVESLNPLGLS